MTRICERSTRQDGKEVRGEDRRSNLSPRRIPHRLLHRYVEPMQCFRLEMVASSIRVRREESHVLAH
jgi:hypothetical protein